MAEEDILYGKKRHLFGGIEPSNMKKFAAKYSGGYILLECELPDDTVVNGQTLCTVAGAVIRRGEGRPPEDEFSGVLVGDIKDSVSFYDTGASATGTYYYAAFPYTTQGVYNRNSVNVCGYNEPESMVKFSAESDYDAEHDVASVILTVDLPDGAAGAVIRRSSTGYPVDITDGYSVTEVTKDGTFAERGLTLGNTYYYTAFPFTVTNGVRTYNKSMKNRCNVICKKYKYYFGYDLDTTDPNPLTRVSYPGYPDKVDNANYTPARMNFSDDEFDYGDWDLEPGKYFMPRPCMLNFDGSIYNYLDPNDYSKTVNGESSSVTILGYDINAMMEWPKIYTKRELVDGVYKFRCSDGPVDDDWDCYCNYDKDGNVIDHFYTAIYQSVHTSSKDILRSISGQKPVTSMYVETALEQSVKNGEDWCISTLVDHLLIQDLLVLMCKSTNCQEAYGYGVCGNSSYTLESQGKLNDKGLFYGAKPGSGYVQSKTFVKVFGMENYWGCLSQQLVGWLYTNTTYDRYEQRINLTGEYNFDGSGYTRVLNSSCNSEQNFGTADGYIDKMMVQNFGRLIGGVGTGGSTGTTYGSATTYECDYVSAPQGSEGKFWYACVGGSNRDVYTAVGPFTVDFVDKSVAHGYKCSRLSCKPSKTTE